MNIVVFIKPDLEGNTGDATETATVHTYVDPDDKAAIEVALQFKEKVGGEVTALAVQGEQADEALREAYAMGVDHAVLLAVTEETPAAVAAAINKIGYDVVITGNQAGAQIAENLQIPHMRYEKETLETLKEKVPCLLTISSDQIKTRYMQMAGIFSAYKKEVKTLSLN